ISFFVLAMAAASAAVAHPHFQKTVPAQLPGGVEATITYGTTPANEMRASEVKAGTFVTPRRPMLKLSGELKAGATTLPAGEYTIGVIKNSETDWTMALYPGRLPMGGAAPDASKAIKLESTYSGTAGKADHMLIDITPGSGKFE